MKSIFLLLALCCSTVQAAPAVDILSKFTAADVPATGQDEQPSKPSLDEIREKSAKKSAPADLPGKGLAQHPMLYIGEGFNTMFVVNNGKVVWTYSTGGGYEFDDIWLLSNGNILYSRMQYAEEITPQKKVVWHLDAENKCEIHSLQPIGLDKVMVMQNGLPPKLMIVNKKTAKVELSHELTPPTESGVHGQFRRGRITAAGTYLVSWLSGNKVIEYDKDFKEIWSYAIQSPWAAVRLKNGNTLITDEKDELTREVNPKGETVWEFKLSELPPTIPMTGSQTFTRLSTGNTVICSRGDNGKGCQLIEITPGKQVVWALYDWKNLGPATAVQMLDEPGIAEKPGELER